MAVWHITEDIISEAEDELQTGRWINGKAPAPNTKPEEFRLLDGDKNVYFGGIVYLEAHDTGFEPLWDWAMPGWGCTEIQYKHPSTGAWVTL